MGAATDRMMGISLQLDCEGACGDASGGVTGTVAGQLEGSRDRAETSSNSAGKRIPR